MPDRWTSRDGETEVTDWSPDMRVVDQLIQESAWFYGKPKREPSPDAWRWWERVLQAVVWVLFVGGVVVVLGLFGLALS